MAIELAALMLLALLAALALGLWVAITLVAIGWVFLGLFTSVPTFQVVPTTIWSAGASWTLAALPLFIWMGEILVRSRMSESLFKGLSPWLQWLPGRLMHVNVVGSGIFAAVSGSSAATTATIGRMSLPELECRGYNMRMAIGALAGGGSLGLLIPPSLAMIVYGVSAGVSVPRLFIAAIVPGLIVICLFTTYIVISSLLTDRSDVEVIETVSWHERIQALTHLLPVPVLILAVIGSIYAGIATVTEAAAFGVVGALFISWMSNRLNSESFIESLAGATRTSCMIGFIVVCAAVLSSAAAFLGIPRELASWVGTLALTRYEFIAVLLVLYVLLGCFLDGFSIIVLTTAVIMPLMAAQGIDLIWFGVFITLVVEMSQITPPVGFNLYVIQALTGRNIFDIGLAALPFFLLLNIAVLILTVFPELVHLI